MRATALYVVYFVFCGRLPAGVHAMSRKRKPTRATTKLVGNELRIRCKLGRSRKRLKIFVKFADEPTPQHPYVAMFMMGTSYLKNSSRCALYTDKKELRAHLEGIRECLLAQYGWTFALPKCLPGEEPIKMPETIKFPAKFPVRKSRSR